MITIRVTGPRGSGHEQVDPSERVGAVLPLFIERYATPFSDVWALHLHRSPGSLDPLKSFETQGVVEGSALAVETAGTAPVHGGEAAEKNARVIGELVNRTATTLLPERLSGRQRASRIAKGVFSRSEKQERLESADATTAVARGLVFDTGRSSRFRQATASTSYVSLLDDRIAYGRIRRAGVVSVIGAEPNAGRSTVATVLASTLAEARQRTSRADRGRPDELSTSQTCWRRDSVRRRGRGEVSL